MLSSKSFSTASARGEDKIFVNAEISRLIYFNSAAVSCSWVSRFPACAELLVRALDIDYYDDIR